MAEVLLLAIGSPAVLDDVFAAAVIAGDDLSNHSSNLSFGLVPLPKQLKHEVTQTINPDHDSVRFYVLRTTQYMTVDKLGVPSRPGDAGAFL